MDAHPNVIIPLENSGLIHLYFKYRKVKTWNETRLREIIRDFRTLIRVESWNLDWERLDRQVKGMADLDIGFTDIIKIIYGHFNSEFEKEAITCLGDKTPFNSLYGAEIFKIFPGAKYIHMLRDYRANLASMKQHDVFSPSETGMLMQWKKSTRRISRLAKDHPEQYLQLRYEDLVTRPEQCFEQVCNFLGIVYQPELLDAKNRQAAISKIYNQEFITNWQSDLAGDIKPDNIDKWKKTLNSGSVRKADYIAGKTGIPFQYLPVYERFSFAFIMMTELKILLFRLNEVNRHIFDRLPWKWKIRIKNRKVKLIPGLIIRYRKRFERD